MIEEAFMVMLIGIGGGGFFLGWGSRGGQVRSMSRLSSQVPHIDFGMWNPDSFLHKIIAFVLRVIVPIQL